MISRTRSTILLFAAAIVLCALPAQAEVKAALVIGNSRYGISPLETPENDARDIAKSLSAKGFEAMFLLNADKREMEEALQGFYGKLKGADVGLFYFAGHGMQIDGANYILPVRDAIETEIEAKYKSVHAGMILDTMQASGCKTTIVILDACRNNSFKRMGRSASRGLASMDAFTGSIIAFSTSPGSVALDGQGRNSPYAQALLRRLEEPNQPIEAMFKSVRRDVIEATGGFQVPWETTSLVADVYLIKTEVATAPAPAAPAPAPAVPQVPVEGQQARDLGQSKGQPTAFVPPTF